MIVLNQSIRDVSVREMLEAMHDRPDAEVFRWFQTSTVNADGVPQPGETLRLTLGQLRRELERDPA